MSALPKFIVEDGTCVSGANTFALPADGHAYFPLRLGGELWDISAEGNKHCDKDICKALIVSMDFLKCLNWKRQPRHCRCCKNDLPKPVICCDCDACGHVYERLKEAQLIVADAILNGWHPWKSEGGDTGLGSDVMVDSMSRSGSTIKFTNPVALSSLKSKNCKTLASHISSDTIGARIQSLLGCYLQDEDAGGITVIS